MKLLSLNLMFTERCNALCRHCCVRSHMYGGRDMPIDDVFRYIDELAGLLTDEKGEFSVCFSGGEPFLRYPDLLRATRYAGERGAFRISCVTNGFWGNNYATAQEWVTELQKAGMHTLCFSLDDFHQEYIDFDWVRSAISACVDKRMNIAVKCAVTNNTRRLHEILSDLGNLLLDNDVAIQEIACVPQGEPPDSVSGSEYILTEGIPHDLCLGMILTILPDGTTFPCCGDGWNDRLIVGNAQSETVADLMARAKNLSLLAALRDNGPAFFVPYFSELGIPLPEGRYVNACHLCKTVLEHSESGRILPLALGDWKIKRVEKCLGGLWEPTREEYERLRVLAQENPGIRHV